MRVIVDSKYSFLKDFIESLPINFNRDGELLYEGRNVVKAFEHNGEKFVVKSFTGVSKLNRYIYRWIRKSKAQRSFEFSKLFIDNGIATPSPIAWIDKYKGLSLSESYYISNYTDWPPLLNFIGTKEEETLLTHLAAFAYELHHKGIFHGDFNLTNILIGQGEGRPQFSLIDNNRTKFKGYSLKRGACNFRRLTLERAHFIVIAKKYSELCGVEYETVFKEIIEARDKFVDKIKRKARVKSWLKKLKRQKA